MTEVGPQVDQLLGKVNARRKQAYVSPDATESNITTQRRPVRSEPGPLNLKDEAGMSIEDDRVYRSPTSRLIRGSLAATLKDIKKDPQMRADLLPAFGSGSRKLAEDLDTLDAQFHKNVRLIDIGKGDRKRDGIFVVELDLKKPSEEKDNKIPKIVIGGAFSTSWQNAMLSELFALYGKHVFIPTYPDQMKEFDGGRTFLEKWKNAYKETYNSFKSMLEKLGFPEVDVVGHSLGGEFALMLAADAELRKKVKIHDVLALSPAGFNRRFMLEEGAAQGKVMAATNADPEARLMMFDHLDPDIHLKSGMKPGTGFFAPLIDGLSFLGGGRAAASHIIKPRTIRDASRFVTGTIEIWTGDSDPVIKPDPIIKTVRKAKGENNVRLYIVRGGNHNTLVTNAFGLLRESENRKNDEYSPKPVPVDITALERAGSEAVLAAIKQNSPTV